MVDLKKRALTEREADHPIHTIFLQRWSPRAMTGKKIPEDVLHTLFEAARWAPSSNNEQEWRFLYAQSGTDFFEDFFGLLAEGNKVWCRKASYLLVVISRKTFIRTNKPNPVHSLDTGAALQNLLLQAAEMGLVGHAMAGFDREKAAKYLGVPDTFQVEAMCAIGVPARPSTLPSELESREGPSGRKPITKFALEGRFAFKD